MCLLALLQKCKQKEQNGDIFLRKMPFDARRIQGPESSEDYRQFIVENTEKILKSKEQKNRQDGRNDKDMRRIFLQPGVISQAKGSAYIETGHTKVICSVFDPREKPRHAEHNLRGTLNCEFKFASFSSHTRIGHVQDSRDKEYSIVLKNALEPAVCLHEFPNFQVDVQVLVLQDGGSSLAAAITCAGLALADAAVPMYDLVVGVSQIIRGSQILMDPTLEEENQALLSHNSNYATMTVALLPAFSQVAQLVQVGHSDPSHLDEGLAMLLSAGTEIHAAVQKTIISNVKQQLQVQESRKECNTTRSGTEIQAAVQKTINSNVKQELQVQETGKECNTHAGNGTSDVLMSS